MSAFFTFVALVLGNAHRDWNPLGCIVVYVEIGSPNGLGGNRSALVAKGRPIRAVCGRFTAYPEVKPDVTNSGKFRCETDNQCEPLFALTHKSLCAKSHAPAEPEPATSVAYCFATNPNVPPETLAPLSSISLSP